MVWGVSIGCETMAAGWEKTMKITLNLGVHYTGTGALVDVCEENPQIFGGDTLSVWGRQAPQISTLMKLARDPNDGSAPDQPVNPRALNLLKIHLQEEEKAGTDRLIVDAVNLLGTRQDNLRARKLYRLAKGRLTRVLDAFEGHDVRLHLCPRSYDGYWSAALFEAVSTGAAQPEDAVLDYLVTQPTRWRHLAEFILEAAPELRLDVASFEAFGNRPQDLLGALYGSNGDAVELHAPSAALADKLRADPTWNAFEQHQLQTLRDQYQEDIHWFETQNLDNLHYHKPQRALRKQPPASQNQTAIRPRRVTLERGSDYDRQTRSVG